jgi:2C-methyl-D-erythritol 2,4-cyclodiphosphate synthase
VSKIRNVLAGMFVESFIEVFQLMFGDKRSFSRRLIVVMTAAVIALILQSFLKTTQQPQQAFEQKITRLKDTEESLKDLMTFVRDQQRQLEESQAVVTELQAEHEKLKPVVETDRKVVDAVLAAQTARQSVNVWTERGLGFVIGTLGSLLATFIWTFFSDLRKKRRALAAAIK